MPDVSDRLRDDIRSGEFAPGMRLVEAQLTERYAVGRAAIRAAIVELSAEGLVVHETNRGATVRRIAVSEAIEIAQARAVLEGLLARAAAERATAEERADLRRIIADMETAVDRDDQPAYSALNEALHRRIREVSQHSVGSELVGNLRNRGAQHEFQLAVKPGRSAVSLGQHRAIVAAIVANDGPEAERAMHAHLASVEAALADYLD